MDPEEAELQNDYRYRSYAAVIEKALRNFESSSEWADLISSLGKLNKALQSNLKYSLLPRRLIIGKRLAQCLHPALPSGVHLKALETYEVIFKIIGTKWLAKDLFIYSSGLFPLLGHAAMSVKPVLLTLYERYFLPLQRALLPSLQAFIMGLLPGLEEGAEVYDRTDALLVKLSVLVGQSVFYGALWGSVLICPLVRLPASLFIVAHFDHSITAKEQKFMLGTDHRLVVKAVCLALQDSNVLVQRNTLEILLYFFPFTTFQDPGECAIPLKQDEMISVVSAASAPFTLQELLQGQDSTSQVVYESSTPYVSVSLPPVVTSSLTPVPSSKQVTSVYGTPSGSSAPFTLQRLLQGKGSTSQVVSVPSTPYVAVSMPKVVTSQLTPVPSSKQVTSVYTTQTGSPAPFTLQELLQGKGSTSQVVSVPSTPYVTVSTPQVVSSLLTPVPSSKQVTTVYTTQTGSPAPFTLQELLEGQDQTSQVVYGSSTPYISVSLPQVASQLTSVPSSKQVTSVYGTQTGSFAPLTLQESTTYDGLIQTVDTTDQLVSGSTPYVAVSLPQVTSQLTPVPNSKQVTSVYGTMTGSSAPFTLQKLLQGKGSTSQVISVPSTPYVAVSLPQSVTSQSITVPSSKPVTSVYGTQTGSSAPFTLQASTTYDGRIQTPDTTSPLVLGSSTPYVAVSLPQVTSQLTPAPSTKQVTSVYTTQTGSPAPFAMRELLQGQDSTSQVFSGSSAPYASVSLPQVFTSQLAGPSSKSITAVYGSQTGSSAPYTLQGSTTYGGLIQPQNAKDGSSTGSSVLQTLTGDISNPSSSFSTLKRYYSVKG
nr:Dopey family member 2 [Danio rerio]